MKKFLRVTSLVLTALVLLACLGCRASQSGSMETTVPKLTNPSNTEPHFTTRVPTQPSSIPTHPDTEPTTAPTVPSTGSTDPETAEGRIAVVILIDTSASMSMGKLEAAIEGAKAYVNALGDRDFCGIASLALPHLGGSEIVDILPLSQKEAIMEMIDGIANDSPYGPTVFSDAIMRAGCSLSDIKNVERKHIILITDGDPGDDYDTYLPYIQANVEDNITMSVITIDTHPSRQEQMQNTADAGGGRYYNIAAEDLERVSEIVLQDLAEMQGSGSENP